MHTSVSLVCIYMYVYLYAYICLNKYIHICCMHVEISLYVPDMHEFVCIYVCSHTCMSMYVCMSIHK